MGNVIRWTALAALGIAVAAPAAHGYDGYRHDDRYAYDGGYDDGYGGAHYDVGYVLRVDPIIDVVHEPVRREECWDEPVTWREPVRYRRPDRAPAVLGAIVGGIIGNQFGSGHGRDAATLAGAALGYASVRDAQRRDAYYGGGYYGERVSHGYERRCAVRTEYYRDERVLGYDVTYEYDGQTYRTRTDHHPGDTIRVRVDVVAVQ